VPATVVRVDPNGRFMFVRVENPGVDVFVHSSFFSRMRTVPREGDEVHITVEASDRGPRASSFEA
jgi:cold shock CspA family protein